jgi:hypothetical protein
MKRSSAHALLSPARARNCLILNQFATPGLGSLMARRLVAGSGQLLLAVSGFLLFCAWFFNLITKYYAMITQDIDPQLHPRLALAGVGLFSLAWLWSWITSISLLQEAKRNERDGRLFDVPPVLPHD